MFNLYQPGQAVDQDTGFATTGAGKHQRVF